MLRVYAFIHLLNCFLLFCLIFSDMHHEGSSKSLFLMFPSDFQIFYILFLVLSLKDSPKCLVQYCHIYLILASL